MNETLNDISEAAANVANESFVKTSTKFCAWVKSFLTWEHLFKLIIAVVVILIIWIIYKLIRRGIKKIPEKKLSVQRSEIVLRLLKYVFYVIVVLYILSLFGVNLKAIWGAAGIAGVAIGFAAQTSVSNLISGLFVLTEGSIHVGDTIVVDGITGIVDEVKLLSIRVHTFDNQMVRIPNSTIINNNLTNNSFHSKRRITVTLDVTYDSDLQLALDTYKKAAESCPTVLKNPAPSAWVEGFNDTGIDITVAAWFKPNDFLQTKSDLHMAILREMKEAGLDTPYPHMDISISQEDDIAIKNKAQQK